MEFFLPLSLVLDWPFEECTRRKKKVCSLAIKLFAMSWWWIFIVMFYTDFMVLGAFLSIYTTQYQAAIAYVRVIYGKKIVNLNTSMECIRW